MTDISEIVVLPTLVNHLRRVAPGVLIEAERISSDSARRLESGDIDLAVGFMPQLEAGFYQQTLFEQNFVCLAAERHPRVRSKPNKQAFLAEGHIVVTTSGTGHTIVDKVLAKKGYRRRVVMKVPSFLAVAQPDIYVKGGDYTLETLNQDERRTVEQAGGRIVIIPFVPGKSTTTLLKKIARL